jgi:DNA modification methylase
MARKASRTGFRDSRKVVFGESDFRVPDYGDGMDRRKFCSSIAAVAAVGSSAVSDLDDRPEKGKSAYSSAIPLIPVSLHRIFFAAAQDMGRVGDASVDLVVTSPPYPMIEMWDGIFAAQNCKIMDALGRDSRLAFELMHGELDKVWAECFRVLKDGGFLCVNIGDATRTINRDFQLYNNHSRVVAACLKTGFTNLPNIIWRKQTNAPNKFMGSGMLPCGAYVTLEHEWILVFRKAGKRIYKSDREKALRRSSAFFWEERNTWFSDVWDIKGTRQTIVNSQTRERNASFPLEIPLRLVDMYSQLGDTVLDPFIGMGTTMVAAMLAGRNCIGFEIDSALKPSIVDFVESMNEATMNRLVDDRLERHLSFVKERENSGREIKYHNCKLGCKVMTSQETDIDLVRPEKITRVDGGGLFFECSYRS